MILCLFSVFALFFRRILQDSFLRFYIRVCYALPWEERHFAASGMIRRRFRAVALRFDVSLIRA
jgi:hypothetical protein